MKLNLLLDNKKGILNGYTNIDPFGPDSRCETDQRLKGDIFPLDWISDDGECEEILSRNTLCYFPMSMIGTAISSWLKKISKNGIITIEEIDYSLVCEAVSTGTITLKEAQTLLYGVQDKKWNIKKSGLNLSLISDFIEGSNFKILKKRIHNLSFIIQAIRL